MEKRLHLILKKHEYDFEVWYETIRDYQELSIIPYNPYWIDIARKSSNIEDSLHQIFDIFSGFSGSGTWTREETLDYGTGFRICILSGQIGNHYCLSVDKESIFLEAFIAHPECIPKMFDFFVQKIADFSRFGVFSYTESELLNEFTTKAYRTLLKPKIKGELPLLFRNFFIAQAEQYFDFDLGVLQVSWPLDKFTMKQFLKEGCQAFKIVHQLNLALWKKHNSRKT